MVRRAEAATGGRPRGGRDGSRPLRRTVVPSNGSPIHRMDRCHYESISLGKEVHPRPSKDERFHGVQADTPIVAVKDATSPLRARARPQCPPNSNAPVVELRAAVLALAVDSPDIALERNERRWIPNADARDDGGDLGRCRSEWMRRKDRACRHVRCGRFEQCERLHEQLFRPSNYPT
jgi:hypothetical protein